MAWVKPVRKQNRFQFRKSVVFPAFIFLIFSAYTNQTIALTLRSSVSNFESTGSRLLEYEQDWDVPRDSNSTSLSPGIESAESGKNAHTFVMTNSTVDSKISRSHDNVSIFSSSNSTQGVGKEYVNADAGDVPENQVNEGEEYVEPNGESSSNVKINASVTQDDDYADSGANKDKIEDTDDDFEKISGKEPVLRQWIDFVMNFLPEGAPISVLVLALFSSTICCCLCVCKSRISGRRICCCISSPDKYESSIPGRSAANIPKGRYGYGHVNQKPNSELEMMQTQNRDIELEMVPTRRIRTVSLETLKQKADRGFQKIPLVNAKAFEGSWDASEVVDDVWGITLAVVPPENVLIHDLKSFHIHCIASGIVQNMCKFYFYALDQRSHKYMCELTISSDTLRATCVFKQDSPSIQSPDNLSELFGSVIKQILSTR